jgi:hypothetical protein
MGGQGGFYWVSGCRGWIRVDERERGERGGGRVMEGEGGNRDEIWRLEEETQRSIGRKREASNEASP